MTSARRYGHASGLFVIERLNEAGRWIPRSTSSTIEAAQDRAWKLLTTEGGEVRVRKGRQIVSKGAGYVPGDV